MTDLNQKAAELFGNLDSRGSIPVFNQSANPAYSPLGNSHSLSEYEADYARSRGRNVDMPDDFYGEKVTGSKSFSASLTLSENHHRLESGEVIVEKSSYLSKSSNGSDRVSSEQYQAMTESSSFQELSELASRSMESNPEQPTTSESEVVSEESASEEEAAE